MPSYRMRGAVADSNFARITGDNEPCTLRATDRLAAMAEALELLGVVVEPTPDVDLVINLTEIPLKLPPIERRVPVYKRIVEGIYQQDVNGKFYFTTEDEDFDGPYDTLPQCSAASQQYAKYLNDGPSSPYPET